MKVDYNFNKARWRRVLVIPACQCNWITSTLIHFFVGFNLQRQEKRPRRFAFFLSQRLEISQVAFSLSCDESNFSEGGLLDCRWNRDLSQSFESWGRLKPWKCCDSDNLWRFLVGDFSTLYHPSKTPLNISVFFWHECLFFWFFFWWLNHQALWSFGLRFFTPGSAECTGASPLNTCISYLSAVEAVPAVNRLGHVLNTGRTRLQAGQLFSAVFQSAEDLRALKSAPFGHDPLEGATETCKAQCIWFNRVSLQSHQIQSVAGTATYSHVQPRLAEVRIWLLEEMVRF